MNTSTLPRGVLLEERRLDVTPGCLLEQQHREHLDVALRCFIGGKTPRRYPEVFIGAATSQHLDVTPRCSLEDTSRTPRR